MFCRCEEEIPVYCNTVVTNTHYAPAVALIADELYDRLVAEVDKILQTPGLAECGQFIRSLVCTILFPPCNGNMDKLIPICQSQCPLIADQLEQCRMRLSNGMFPILHDLVYNKFINECRDPLGYYIISQQYIESHVDPNRCRTISKL